MKAFAIVLALALFASMSAAVNISSCQALNQPNTVYTLTQDVTSSGTCFTVNATNVTIDCQGHGVAGSNLSDTYGVYTNQQRTTITNCNISNFAKGVYLEGAGNGSVRNSNVKTTHSPGSAILLSSSSQNTLSNLTVTSNFPNSRGIYIDFSSNNTLSNLTVTSNHSYGIILTTYSNYNTLSNLTATSNSGVGIILYFGSNYNTLSNLTATSNSGYGIVLDSSSQNTLSNLTAASNSNYGINLISSSNNLFINCTNSISSNNSIPRFYSNSPQNISSSGNTGWWPLLGADGSGATTGAKTAYYNGTSGGRNWDWTTNSSLTYWFNNTTQGCTCGVLSTPNYVCTLTSDLTSSGTCFNITANNVTINCEGHSISASLSPGKGIYSGANGTFVQNCAITGFAYGVMFKDSFYSTILNTNATANKAGGDQYGLYILGGGSNSISYSKGISTDGSFSVSQAAGIHIEKSSNNTISHSVGNATSWCGILISEGYGTTQVARYNMIENSEGRSYNGCGMAIYYSGSNQVINNTFHLHMASSMFADRGSLSLHETMSNQVMGNKLVSGGGAGDLLKLYVYSTTSNLFYWNNFTATSGKYINHNGGFGQNFYNTTINGKGEGNIYANVMDGSVQVAGTEHSSGFPSLFIGTEGPGVPYNAATSQGKVSANVVDYAPLTKIPAYNCANNSLVGDANGDGAINAADALVISKMSVGIIPRPQDMCCVDVNNNCVVNSIDSLMVMRYYSTLPPYGYAGQHCWQVPRTITLNVTSTACQAWAAQTGNLTCSSNASLFAAPCQNLTFSNWTLLSGGCVIQDSYSPNTSITLYGNCSVQAVFVPAPMPSGNGTNSTNGTKGAPLPSGMPDLSIQSITVPSGIVGAPISGVLVVKNIGTAASQPSSAAYYVNGNIAGTIDVPSLAPGASYASPFTVKCATQGTMVVSASANANRLVVESDYRNNDKAATVVCNRGALVQKAQSQDYLSASMAGAYGNYFGRVAGLFETYLAGFNQAR